MRDAGVQSSLPFLRHRSGHIGQLLSQQIGHERIECSVRPSGVRCGQHGQKLLGMHQRESPLPTMGSIMRERDISAGASA
jgi:hypothetical protein